MKVAFATTDGINVDEHFGRAGRFMIYEFSRNDYWEMEIRVFSDEGRDKAVEGTRGQGDAHDAAVNAKVERLADCGIIYITSIGGPSAARLARKGVMPVKVESGVPISASASKLMETIKGSPPPWLKRLLGD